MPLKVLIDRELVSTRSRAQAMILAGHILVNDTPITKSGTLVCADATIRLREPELQYVSRGALKLKGAIEKFGVNANGRVGIDVGSSTGGFTEVLLEEGAIHVYAIDVGTNQLAWKIRNDPRVTVKENYNARYFKESDFPAISEGLRPSLLVMDVSFISIRLILPAVVTVLETGADLLVLFKPQFELGREAIGEGGIVKDQSAAKIALNETTKWAIKFGLQLEGTADSPITGTDGNHEYLVHWKKTN
jgi:23S rRNA (cytidine1920-2'-O)/16S rRNA (cytidine1409-2'-O)-methyltransferase